MSTDDTAEGALLELASSLVDEVAAARLVELTGGLDPAPPRSRDWRTLSPRQLGLAEATNPDLPATPDRPGEHHCDICGCADREQIEPGPDKDYFGAEKAAWMCKDANARACEARKLHRYPPRPDLVPDALLSAVGNADAAQAVQRQAQQQPGQQQGWYQPEGWVSSQYGAYDVNGQWHPALPAYQAYSHTIAGGASTGHLLSGQARPHYYAGPNYLPMALYGAEPAQEASGGQDTPGSGGRVLEGFYESARGVTQAGSDLPVQSPELPEAAPQRPARQQRPSRDRYGRHRPLRYTGRR